MTGRECYKNIGKTDASCLVSCQGVYADVEQDTKTESLVYKEEGMKDLIAEYENYKLGFHEKMVLSRSLKGDIL